MAHDQDQAHPSEATYFKVFASLMMLTVVTVLVSRVHLGAVGNIVVGMAIATVKASMVALIFMHLWYEVGKWKIVMLVPPCILFAVIVFALTPDVAYKPTHAAPLAAESHAADAGHEADAGAGH